MMMIVIVDAAINHACIECVFDYLLIIARMIYVCRAKYVEQSM